MPTEKELTGYPSIDKPWLKFYESERKPMLQVGLYDYLKACNKNNLEETAMVYFNEKISFAEMFKRIESMSCVFVRNGVKPKDKVVVLALNTPDMIFAIYALNRIGAVACIEYVTQKENSLGEITKRYKAKYAVVLDAFYSKYINVLSENGIEKVFVSKISDAMPNIMRCLALLKSDKRIKQGKNVVFLSKECKNNIGLEDAYCWNSNETAVILSTSGTTGIPKRAELSSDAINAHAYQVDYVDFKLTCGTSLLAIAPPFLAFGISLSIHMPLCKGVCLLLSPKPDPKSVVRDFVKYKPNFFIGAHAFMDEIMSNKKIQNMDLSFVNVIELGGESVPKEYVEKINTFLKQHNSSGEAYVGFGMTELAACSTTESKTARRIGSVGIPLCDVNVKVVDIESNKELQYEKEGELCFSSPCMMNEYFENKEATDTMIEIDDEGNKWLHTGDLGRIDEDGFVYVIGRIKRIYVTIDQGTNAPVKLYPDYVEHILNSRNDIERCAVVVIEDPERMNVPIAFIKVVQSKKIDINELNKYFDSNTESYNKPVKYKFIDELPILPNGKVDYRALEKETENL